jgi:condensin-2 complex subunit D3
MKMDMDEDESSIGDVSSSHDDRQESEEEQDDPAELRQAVNTLFHDTDNHHPLTTTPSECWTTLQNHFQRQPPNVSVREALCFLTNDELSNLTSVLCMAMENRMEITAATPITSAMLLSPEDDEEQEQDPNTELVEEAETMTTTRNNTTVTTTMDDTFQPTLTYTALAAATVYAKLIAMPGALGVGLIEMETLSGGLLNVLQRWRKELANHKNNYLATFESQINNNKAQKINRKRKKYLVDDEDEEKDRNDENHGEEKLTSQQLWSMGLRLTECVFQIPMRSREFASWNDEANDILIECIAKSMATVQAMTSRNNIHETQNSTLQTAAEALKACVCLESITEASSLSQEDEPDSTCSVHHILQKRHDRMVAILRCLYPTLILQDALPQGETGKIVAATSAAYCLEHLVHALHQHLVSHPAQWTTIKTQRHVSDQDSSEPSRDSPSTPNHTSSTKESETTPKTAHKKRLRRSMDSRSPCASSMTPRPKSKSTSVPRGEKCKPRMVFSAILGLLQKLAITKGLEKASSRACTVQTLHRCISQLPLLERTHFLKFVIQLCHSKVSVHRLVACELVGCILLEDWLWSDDFTVIAVEVEESLSTPFQSKSKSTPSLTVNRKSLSSLMKESSSNKPLALFNALQGRLVDKVPTIRSVAATTISNICTRLLEVYAETENSFVVGLVSVLGEEMDDLIQCLRRRAVGDEKATVRKSACVALVNLMIASIKALMKSQAHFTDYDKDVQILGELCQDSSVMTRKTAAEGLTKLLLEFSSSSDQNISSLLPQTWASTALTMVLDSEPGCVAKGVELVEQLILFPIVSDDDDTDCLSRMAWKILSILDDASSAQGNFKSANEALRVALEKSISSADSRSYVASLFKTIHRVATSTLDEAMHGNLFSPDVEDQRTGVWCLFEAAMYHTKDNKSFASVIKRNKIDFDFLGLSWNRLFELFTSHATPGRAKSRLQVTMRHCLKILSRLAQFVDIETCRKTSDNLQSLIGNFTLSPDIIGPAISALVATTIALEQHLSHGKPNSQCVFWIREVFQKCENQIASFVGRTIQDNEVPFLARAFFTLGELSMIGFDSSENNKKDNLAEHAGQQRSETAGAAFRLPVGFHEKPGKQLVAFVQAFMSDTLPGVEETLTPSAVRAHAFIALGKLCIRDESLARHSLNILARELQGNMGQGNWIVQSNSLLVLGDLCVRYTSMVDRFLPVMAACLQAGVTDIRVDALSSFCNDGSALVRKHAVLLLSNLLLQDYIKWRGLLFHRFLVATVSSKDNVRRVSSH